MKRARFEFRYSSWMERLSTLTPLSARYACCRTISFLSSSEGTHVLFGSILSAAFIIAPLIFKGILLLIYKVNVFIIKFLSQFALYLLLFIIG